MILQQCVLPVYICDAVEEWETVLCELPLLSVSRDATVDVKLHANCNALPLVLSHNASSVAVQLLHTHCNYLPSQHYCITRHPTPNHTVDRNCAQGVCVRMFC